MVEKNFPQAIYGEILAEIESLLWIDVNKVDTKRADTYR